MGIFLQKLRSYVKPPSKKQETEHLQGGSNSSSAKHLKQDNAGRKKNKEATKKGWLDLELRTTIKLPDVLQ